MHRPPLHDGFTVAPKLEPVTLHPSAGSSIGILGRGKPRDPEGPDKQVLIGSKSPSLDPTVPRGAEAVDLLLPGPEMSLNEHCSDHVFLTIATRLSQPS
ncbi:hypothetical protein TNCV_2990031 [Trichonephila clavipes]|nr:hypothetical protein TNCV_2990031 [Trichonephila clavipes]